MNNNLKYQDNFIIQKLRMKIYMLNYLKIKEMDKEKRKKNFLLLLLYY